MPGTSRSPTSTKPSSAAEAVAKARKNAAEEGRAVAQMQKRISSLETQLNALKQQKKESDAAKTAAEEQLERLTEEKINSDAAKTTAEEEVQKKVKEIEGLNVQVKEINTELSEVKRNNDEKLKEIENEKGPREEISALIAKAKEARNELEEENTLRNKLTALQEKLEKSLKEKTDLISEEWKLPKFRAKMKFSRENFDLGFVDTFLQRIRYVGTEADKDHGLDARRLHLEEIIGAHFVRGGMVLHYKKLHKKLCDYIVCTLASTKQGGDVDTLNVESGKARILEKEYELITLIDKQLRRKLSQGEWCSLKFYTGDSDLEETEISKSVKLAFLLFVGDGEADSRFFRQYDYCTRKLARSALSGQVDMRDNRVQTSNAEIRTADNNLKQLLGTLSEVARNIQHECRYVSELVNQDLRVLNAMMEHYQEQKLAVTKLIYSSIMLPISRIIVLLFLAKHFPVQITKKVWSEEIVFKLLNPMEHFLPEKYDLKAPDQLDKDQSSIYNCILILLHSDRSPVERGDGTGESSSGDHSE